MRLTGINWHNKIIMVKKKAFTLVELLIAIGILMMLVLLIVPNVWRARINSNESIAVSNLKSLNSALNLYYINNDQFPSGLTALIPPASNPGYISPELTDGQEAGYYLIYNYGDQDSFSVNANPRRPGRTGNRYFYLSDTGKIHYNQDGPASSSDPALQ